MNNKLIGRRLRAIRKNLHMTLDGVQRITGLSIKVIEDCEKNKSLNISSIGSLCKCYGVSLSSILSKKTKE